MLVWQRIVIITTSRNSIRHLFRVCAAAAAAELHVMNMHNCANAHVFGDGAFACQTMLLPEPTHTATHRHTATWNGLITLHIFFVHLCCFRFSFLFRSFFTWHVSAMWKDKYLSKFASPNVLHMHRHYYAFDMCMRAATEICSARAVIHARCRWRANEAIQTQTQSIFSSTKEKKKKRLS